MTPRAKPAFFMIVTGTLALGAALSTLAQSARLPATSKLRLPGKNWVLQIETSGFVLEKTQIANDGFGRMMMASNPTTAL